MKRVGSSIGRPFNAKEYISKTKRLDIDSDVYYMCARRAKTLGMTPADYIRMAIENYLKERNGT